MKEVELILLTEGSKCTIYTIKFDTEDITEYQRFYDKFIGDAKLNEDLLLLAQVIDRIAEKGALERYFRPEGKMKDSVAALPVWTSKLRLYCLRISNGILILGNGGFKNSRTYQEDDALRGYVVDLQKFDELLKKGKRDGTVTISERTIDTNDKFKL